MGGRSAVKSNCELFISGNKDFNLIYVMVVLCLRQPLEPTSTSSSILAHRSKRVGAATGNAADCDISQKEILCT
jgi:hypothetical protein